MDDLEREIQRMESTGLKALHNAMVRWLETCKGNGLPIHPHQMRRAKRLALKRVDYFFNEVERILNERIDRGSVCITGPER